MFQKFFDFLSSVGMMILGGLLLVLGSVSIQKIKTLYPEFQFPPLIWYGSQIKQPLSSSDGEKLPESKVLLPVKKDQTEFTESLTAQAVLVVDDKTDTVLWSRNSTEIRPLASISKLMSMLVLKDMSIDWTTTTVIRAADSDGTGSQVRVGEKYTLNNLWDASLIGSSNIAVRALVHASGLSIDEFAARMDAKARELNLATLHFVEPTGLSAENVGNAEDIVGLLQVALQDKKIVQTLAKTDYFLEPVGKPTRRVWSTDMLLTDWIPNDFGHTEVVGKTGHIEDSGYNFVVRLRQSGGQAIRVVVLGADSNEKRFLEARDIGEWIFAHYVWPEEEEYRVVAFQNDN